MLPQFWVTWKHKGPCRQPFQHLSHFLTMSVSPLSHKCSFASLQWIKNLSLLNNGTRSLKQPSISSRSPSPATKTEKHLLLWIQKEQIEIQLKIQLNYYLLTQKMSIKCGVCHKQEKKQVHNVADTVDLFRSGERKGSGRPLCSDSWDRKDNTLLQISIVTEFPVRISDMPVFCSICITWKKSSFLHTYFQK